MYGDGRWVWRYDLDLKIPQFVAAPYFDPPSEELRFLPEGPRVLQNYPDRSAKLGWVAIQHGLARCDGSINVLDLASGENRCFPVPGRPGFFAETTQPGLLLVGLERKLVYFDLLTGEFAEPEVLVTNDERVIINEGLAVEGGVLFGTKDLKLNRPIAAVYFFDSLTQRVHTVFGGQTCSNGKFLRRDAEGASLIDIDSISKTIKSYRLDTKLEQVLEQSQLPGTSSLPGYPDGLRPSPDGESVIVAFYNPDAIADGLAQQLRLSDGAILCEWRIPGSPRVTCPEFVDVAGEVKLVFTTAVEDMSAATRKLAFGAGTLYLANTPFRSKPKPPPLVRITTEVRR
jgi:L-arabinonolactonase